MTRLLTTVLLALFALGAHAATTLKIATIAPEGSAWMRSMRQAASEVDQATDGRVQIKYYPGGVMGDAATVLRKVKLGQLHGGAFTGSELSGVYRDAQIYSLPFLFRQRDEVDAVRAAIDPPLIQGFVDAGWQPLSISGIGFAYLMSTGDITSRQALESRKVWVPQSDAIAEATFRAGGIAPIPLALADVFTSLETGLVDTVGNTPAGAIALQWHNKLRQLLDLPLSYVVGIVAVDNRSWNKLSAEDQAAVLKIFHAASDRIDADNQHADAEAMQALAQLGVKIVEPSADEAARWQAVGREVAGKLEADGRISAGLLAKIRGVLAAQRGE